MHSHFYSSHVLSSPTGIYVFSHHCFSHTHTHTQLSYKTDTDRTRLFKFCLAVADEDEFFIRKAIGWSLREYSRTDKTAVREFVEKNREKLSNLSAREALKHC